MSAPTNNIDDAITCYESASVWPVVVASGSVLLGYIVGRIGHSSDQRTALRRIERSSELIESSTRAL